MIGKDWHKSSYSNTQGGACVEARSSDMTSVDMRDTENREAGHLPFPSSEWAALLASVTR